MNSHILLHFCLKDSLLFCKKTFNKNHRRQPCEVTREGSPALGRGKLSARAADIFAKKLFRKDLISLRNYFSRELLLWPIYLIIRWLRTPKEKAFVLPMVAPADPD